MLIVTVKDCAFPSIKYIFFYSPLNQNFGNPRTHLDIVRSILVNIYIRLLNRASTVGTLHQHYAKSLAIFIL